MARTVTDPPPIPSASTYPGAEVSAADLDGSGYTGLTYLASSILSLWALHTGTWVCDVLDPDGDRLTDPTYTREYRPTPTWNGGNAGTSVGGGVDVWLYVVRKTASPTLDWQIQVSTSVDTLSAQVNGGASTGGAWWALASDLEVDDSNAELEIDFTVTAFTGGLAADNFIEAVAVLPARRGTLPAGDSYGADGNLVFPDLDLFDGELACSTFLLQYLARLIEDIRKRHGTVYSVSDEWDRGDAGVLVDNAIVELLADEIPPDVTQVTFFFRLTSSLGASPEIAIGDVATIVPVTPGSVVRTTITVDPQQGGVFAIRSKACTIAACSVYLERPA